MFFTPNEESISAGLNIEFVEDNRTYRIDSRLAIPNKAKSSQAALKLCPKML